MKFGRAQALISLPTAIGNPAETAALQMRSPPRSPPPPERHDPHEEGQQRSPAAQETTADAKQMPDSKNVGYEEDWYGSEWRQAAGATDWRHSCNRWGDNEWRDW